MGPTERSLLARLAESPQKTRLLIMLGTALIVVLLGYLIDSRIQSKQLQKFQKKQLELKLTYMSKQRLLAKRLHMKREVAAFKKHVLEQLTLLPRNTDFDEILAKATKLAATEGLKFVLFKPGKAINQAFFVAIPIKMTLLGNYHSFASFISKLANLKNLVTIQNFVIVRTKGDSSPMTLSLDIQLYEQSPPGAKQP